MPILKKLSEGTVSLISNTLTAEYTSLIHTLSVFFRYIITEREGYITVSPENVNNKIISKPQLNLTMVNYVIANILNIDMTSQSNLFYSDYVNIPLQIEESFADSLPKATQATLRAIYADKTDVELVTEGALKRIDQYINFIFNQIVSETSDESFDVNVEENITRWNNRKGDNSFVPIDYRFHNTDHNILLQSFIWILCGLTDWLEKETIVLEDVIAAAKILFYGHIDTFESVLLPKVKRDNDEYTIVLNNITLALYHHDFFVSDNAAKSIATIFYNLVKNIDNYDDIKRQLLHFSQKI